ncbi:MAG TPA: DUF3887 domain-containing protein [Anaerolineae bacterium]|nr:DUF3887 domain-containing protein [Anaerolineae bacterium]
MERKWILIVTCALLLAGCGLGPQAMEGAERDAVLVYAEPATDNMLAGLQAGDYAQFSRDQSPEMLEAMTEAAFSELRTMLDSKVGAYVSRQVSRVEDVDDFIAVVYDAQFENEEHVTMRVVFDQATKISGLWFDSPRLRE